MIVGRVRDLLPLVRLSARGDHSETILEFVLDTGFDGQVALPAPLIRKIGARFVGGHLIEFADQFRQMAEHYRAELQLGDSFETVEVILTEGRPLLGNSAVSEMSIHIDMTEGGEVIIEPL